MRFDPEHLIEDNSRQTIADAVFESAKKDKSIIVLTSDATGSAAIGAISKELPEQFVECGIAEQDMVGISAGIASMGMRPFVFGPASFMSARSLEQIKVDVAYSNKNVKLIGVSGGISYGALGESHYSVQDFAVMRAIANLTVICPSDPVQAAALATKLTKHTGPVYMRVGRGKVPVIYDGADNFELGKAVMCRDGIDATIIATGEMVYPALLAALKLQKQNVSVRVLDMFTVKPVDEKAVLKAARETGAIVTVEEHCVYGGLGSAVAQIVSENVPTPVKCVALPNEVLLCGSAAEMKRYYGLDADNIAKAVLETIERK